MIKLKLDKSVGERIMVLRSDRGYTRTTFEEYLQNFYMKLKQIKKGFLLIHYKALQEL